MKNFKVQLTAIAAGVLLASCGDGGNSGGNPNTGLLTPPDPTVSSNGLVADGFLNGATICLDLNSNGACDAGEPTDTTGDGGNDGDYTLSATQSQLDSATLLVLAQAGVTVDTDTGNAITKDFNLTAPVGSTFVSPITTLVQALIESGETAASAESQVQAALGTTLATSTNYLDNTGNAANLNQLHQAAQVLTAIIANGVEELKNSAKTSGLTDAVIFEEVVKSIVSDIQNTTTGTVASIITAVGDGTGTPDIAQIAVANDPVDPTNVTVSGREILSGTISASMTLTSGTTWILDGVVTVGAGNVNIADDAQAQAIKDAGVTLTIEPGTEILAESDGILLVTRGSKLEANGTRTAPITFSSVDEGTDGLGEWGGIVIQGFAPQYGAGGTGPCFGTGTICNVSGEGGTAVAVYGGNDPADDSGSLSYVRIAEGGLVAGPNNEVNGLTLQGVGYGTELEYIQVHDNLDDGIEWFGGTASLKYAVLTNNDDDSLDYDEGYQGNIQHVIIRMNQDSDTPQGSNDPRGIEANSSDDDFVSETNATVANVLIIGGPINNNADSSKGQQPGMRLRGGLTTAVVNSAVKGFDTGCVRIDDADVDTNGALDFTGVDVESQVTLTNVIGDCQDGFYDKRVANTEVNSGANTVTLDTAFALTEVEAQLASAATITPVNNGSNFAFDQTNYIGAVAPGTAQVDAWWSGWTLPGSLGETVAQPGTGGGAVTCDGDDCTVTGTITESVTLTADKNWTIDGVVRVGRGNVTVSTDADVQAIKDAGVTLTVEAGLDVKATSDAILLVTRGSKIMANGSAAAPITFSSVDAGYDGLGEWGGIVVQGFAPQYGAGGTGACFGTGTVCNVSGEGGTAVAVYGGNDPADNSGVLRYVRIAEGGLVAGPNNEVNGLTLQGVGHGTQLEYIQVHDNLDDGIEWFGGTANLKYAVLTNNDDDSLDYDEGYQGNIQHVIIRMNQETDTPQGSNDPRGIEANSSDDEFVSETNAVVANVLVLGGPINNNANSSKGQQPGMRLRGGLTTSVVNSAVRDFNTGCIRIDDADVDVNGTLDFTGDDVRSTVSLTNVMADCADGIYDKRAPDSNEETNVFANTITVDNAYAIAETEARLSADTTITAVNNGSAFAFDSTNYIGAVAPGTTQANAWWSGWIIPGSLDEATVAMPDFVDCSADNCTSTASISGTITENFTLTTNLEWTLDGLVRVGAGNVPVTSDADVQAIKDAGVTLTIPAGSDIKTESDAILLVTRGSKLEAIGTRFDPITFSSKDDNFDGLGEWGGIVIQGFAPQYGAGGTGACFGTGTTCNVSGEGGTSVAVYGGNDPADDSGELRYVRIAEGGLVAGPNNEVNGLTLQGVGHGTQLSYIQVHGNLDDGIEWFGGTVDLKYAVLTNNDDDSLDYDEGYQGNIQYAIVQMNQVSGAEPEGSNDPRGIEANSSDDDFVTETNATIANVTIIGGDINNSSKGNQPGMRLRGALTTAIYNSVVEGFDTGCIRIDDADVDVNGTLDFAGVDEESQVTLTNVLGDCEDGFYDKRDANTATNARANVVTLDDAFAVNELDAQLDAAVAIPEVNNGSTFVFDDTDFIGAVAPGTTAANAWWADWTIPGSLDTPTTAVDSSPSFVTCDTTSCDIRGTIDQDYRMVAGINWTIDGTVKVGNGNVNVADAAAVDAIKAAGVTLTIDAGVNVDATSDAILLVTRGSKLEARGEADAPITFSSQDAGFDGLGEWGGVVIQGFAPQFGAGGTGACFGSGTTCNVSGEGGTDIAVYGGNDPADDSGSLRYVRIAEGGLNAGPGNEVNGLTLQGVGHATDIQYVQVHNNLDDGIEWFGGTVDLKYAVLTNNDDDSLDYDEGYQGNIQHVLIRMNQVATAPEGSNDPRGIEANSSDDEFAPETNATIANVTIIAGPVNNNAGSNKGEQPGMRLRGGLTTAIYNTAVEGFNTGCIRIDDADVDTNGVLDFAAGDVESQVSLINIIGDCGTGNVYDKRVANNETNIVDGTVTLDTAFALTDTAASLATAPMITKVSNGGDFEFDATDYIGAVKPGSDAANTWFSKWVIPGSLD